MWRETHSGNGGGDNTGSPDSGNPVAVNAAANKVRPGEILVTYGNLHRGFEYPLLKFVFITEGDMFGVEKKRKRRKKTNYQGKAIQSFTELSVGDYVVHEEHGLGIYKGIEKVERDKVIKDYIKIESAGKNKRLRRIKSLRVPVLRSFSFPVIYFKCRRSSFP